MKTLRIGIGLVCLLLMGFLLPVSGFNRVEDENQPIEPKAPQGDTVRMTWSGREGKVFSFYGEEKASYKVIWGDGKQDIVIGKGPDTAVRCQHRYSSVREYEVLLFGIPSEKK